MKEILKKKQSILENKKTINGILVDIIKVKRSEVQCLEALQYANSNNLKENLLKIRENEKILLSKVEEIENNPEYVDSEEEVDEEDLEEINNEGILINKLFIGQSDFGSSNEDNNL